MERSPSQPKKKESDTMGVTMMKLALLLALPAAYAIPGIPRSGLPHQMDADAKITAALRRAAGLSDVSDAPLLSAAVMSIKLPCSLLTLRF
eukprot:COSAG06_NODE_3400_length_5395_cov_78.114992_2_plen_91_part_00